MIDELICMLFSYKLLQKKSIFFVYIREPGQNVRCHKFGGPCTSARQICEVFNELKRIITLDVTAGYYSLNETIIIDELTKCEQKLT